MSKWRSRGGVFRRAKYGSGQSSLPLAMDAAKAKTDYSRGWGWSGRTHKKLRKNWGDPPIPPRDSKQSQIRQPALHLPLPKGNGNNLSELRRPKGTQNQVRRATSLSGGEPCFVYFCAVRARKYTKPGSLRDRP